MNEQRDLFAAVDRETDEEFIERWQLRNAGPHVRLCYGMVSHKLRQLKRQGQHALAAELAIAGGHRVCGGDMHWARLYPRPQAGGAQHG